MVPDEFQKNLHLTTKDPSNCKFYTKTGACRFGSLCLRNHVRYKESPTVMIPNFFRDPRLGVAHNSKDASKDYDEIEMIKEFEKFYDDVIGEFCDAGTVEMFKCCQNYVPHLRGNVYVQYTKHEMALKALNMLNGRVYAGRRLEAELSPITNWKIAICSMFDKRLCPRGQACNFLHVFRNPCNAYSVPMRTDFDPEQAFQSGCTVDHNHPVFKYHKQRDGSGCKNETAEPSRNSRKPTKWDSDKNDLSPSYSPSKDIRSRSRSNSKSSSEFRHDRSRSKSKDYPRKVSADQGNSCRQSLKVAIVNSNMVLDEFQKNLHETAKDPSNCKFYLKSGACRHGSLCSRNHVRYEESPTVMIPNFFQHPRLGVAHDSKDALKDYDEIEMIKEFEKFYHDVIGEFRAAGTVVMFKCCQNYVPHLRGNVYVEYAKHEMALEALNMFNGRIYDDGRRLEAGLSPVTNWKSSICGLFDKRLCPRGQACNFLHVFRNPGNAYSVPHRTDFNPEQAFPSAGTVDPNHPVFKYYKQRGDYGCTNETEKPSRNSRKPNKSDSDENERSDSYFFSKDCSSNNRFHSRRGSHSKSRNELHSRSRRPRIHSYSRSCSRSPSRCKDYPRKVSAGQEWFVPVTFCIACGELMKDKDEQKVHAASLKHLLNINQFRSMVILSP